MISFRSRWSRAMRDLLKFLGLARRAGKLVMGDKAVADAARSAVVICTAEDLAQGSLKRAEKAAERGNVRIITLPYSKEEIGRALGRSTCGILALTDEGFARQVIHAAGNGQ